MRPLGGGDCTSRANQEGLAGSPRQLRSGGCRGGGAQQGHSSAGPTAREGGGVGLRIPEPEIYRATWAQKKIRASRTDQGCQKQGCR